MSLSSSTEPLYSTRSQLVAIFSHKLQNNITYFYYIYFPCGASTRFQVMASPYGASRSHSLDTPHWVGLFWTSEQPDAKTSTSQNTTLTRDIHLNPQSQEASSRRPTPYTARPLGSARNVTMLYNYYIVVYKAL